MAGLGFLKEPQNSTRFGASAATTPVGLGRRIRVPRWWVQAFVLNALPETALRSVSDVVLPALSSRVVLPIIDMWHAILERCETNPEARSLSLPLPIPASDELRAELARYWSAPLRFRDETSLNIVTSSRLVGEEFGPKFLELSLSLNVGELCSGRFLRSHAHIEAIDAQSFPQDIHINPNVLRAMGVTPSPVRVAGYLEFECLKATSQRAEAAVQFEVTSDVLLKRHKSFMRDAKLFYDLGCTRWDAELPRMPIAQMRRHAQGGAVQVVWSLPAPPPATATATATEPATTSTPHPASAAPIHHDRPIAAPNPLPTREHEVPSDLDFLIRVATFYESLNSKQRQALERQREFLSDEQFKEFVTPLMNSHQFRGTVS